MSEERRIQEAYQRRASRGHGDRYALERPGNALALRERWDLLLRRLHARGMQGLDGLAILEVGCGTGGELSLLVAHGATPARLSGIELRRDAAESAKQRIPEADIAVGNAVSLPYADGTFDLVYQAVALSSMPTSEMRSQVAAEMVRVTRPGGLVVSYDFAWNPINRDTVGIDERELRRLFPNRPLEIHRVTLAPPLGRWLGDRSVGLLRAAASIPLLRTHRLAIVDIPA
jgi:SAM-dependent methyltransferase